MTSMTFTIKLEDGKTIELSYDEGRELWCFLNRIYDHPTMPAYPPFVRENSPSIPNPWTTPTVTFDANKGL